MAEQAEMRAQRLFSRICPFHLETRGKAFFAKVATTLLAFSAFLEEAPEDAPHGTPQTPLLFQATTLFDRANAGKFQTSMS